MAMQDRPGPCFEFSKKQESDCAQCSLRTWGLFSNLPPEAIRWATSRIENAILSRGGLVYRAGEASDAIFTLRVGVVKLVLEIPGQGTRIVRLLGRGVTLGLERLAGLPYDPHHPFRDAVPEREALNRILLPIRKAVKGSGCNRAILVGHNAAFDLGFLKAAVDRTGFKNSPFHSFSVFDTVSLAGLVFGQTVLARAAQMAGLGWNNTEAHAAIYDVEQTAKLFCQIVNRWRELDPVRIWEAIPTGDKGQAENFGD